LKGCDWGTEKLPGLRELLFWLVLLPLGFWRTCCCCCFLFVEGTGLERELEEEEEMDETDFFSSLLLVVVLREWRAGCEMLEVENARLPEEEEEDEDDDDDDDGADDDKEVEDEEDEEDDDEVDFRAFSTSASMSSITGSVRFRRCFFVPSSSSSS
jgi:hypothetical protein